MTTPSPNSNPPTETAMAAAEKGKYLAEILVNPFGEAMYSRQQSTDIITAHFNSALSASLASVEGERDTLRALLAQNIDVRDKKTDWSTDELIQLYHRRAQDRYRDMMEMANLASDQKATIEALRTDLAAANRRLAEAGAAPFTGDYFLGKLTETGKLRADLATTRDINNQLTDANAKLAITVDSLKADLAAKGQALESAKTVIESNVSYFRAYKTEHDAAYRNCPVEQEKGIHEKRCECQAFMDESEEWLSALARASGKDDKGEK